MKHHRAAVSFLGLVVLVVTIGVVRWLTAVPGEPALPPAVHDDAALVTSEVAEHEPLELPSISAGGAGSAGPPAPGPTIPAPATPAPAAGALGDTDNYVLFGIDRRGDGKGASLADTILVLALDRTTPRVGLVSVPRDAYVDLGEGRLGRVNTVLQVARSARKDPLALGKQVVGDTLGITIANALALDLGVFERAVDELGGVTVKVPCPLRDRFVDAREPGGYRWLDVEPGDVRMDGKTAALYVRSRHGRSDFSRARRQQAVLLGVQAELGGAGGIARVPALWATFEQSVKTDLRRYQILELARRIVRAGPGRLHGVVLGHGHVRPLRTPEGSAVLLLDREAVARSLSGLFSAEKPGIPPRSAICPPKDIAVRGLEGEARSGSLPVAPSPDLG